MKIESNVPFPTSDRLAKYPFADMQPGDSVFLEGLGHQSSPAVSLRQLASRRGWKITCRLVDGGLRCWRVE